MTRGLESLLKSILPVTVFFGTHKSAFGADGDDDLLEEATTTVGV